MPFMRKDLNSKLEKFDIDEELKIDKYGSAE
jgi:hypothetical protein